MFRRCFGTKCSTKSPAKSPANTRNNAAKRIMNQHLSAINKVPYKFAKKLTFMDLLSLRRQRRITEKDFWGAFNYMRRNVNLNTSRQENLREINERYPWYYKNNRWRRYALGPTNFIVQDRNTLQFYSINRNGTKRPVVNPPYKYIRQIPRTSNMTEKAYLKRTRPKPVNTPRRNILNEINRIRANIPSYGNVGKENARRRLHELRKRYKNLGAK